MRGAGQLLAGLYRRLHRWTWTRVELRRLCSGPEPLGSIGRALAGSLRGDASAEELACIERIEGLRRRLEASAAPLRIVDHGAGTPGIQLDTEEMTRGRPVHTTIGELCHTNSLGPAAAALVFRLLRETRPRNCLELGTCLGISTAYQAAAMQLNGQGRIVSIEGSAELAAAARRNLTELGMPEAEVVPGRFHDVLDGVLLASGGLDFVLLDGHHDGPSTVAYAERILPFLSDGGLLVLDDIAWSGGMREAWSRIRSKPRVAASVDLFWLGICAVAPGPGARRDFRVSML